MILHFLGWAFLKVGENSLFSTGIKSNDTGFLKVKHV